MHAEMYGEFEKKKKCLSSYVLKVEQKWRKEEGREKLKGDMKTSFVTT